MNGEQNPAYTPETPYTGAVIFDRGLFHFVAI
jgi:hypothetical protein